MGADVAEKTVLTLVAVPVFAAPLSLLPGCTARTRSTCPTQATVPHGHHLHARYDHRTSVHWGLLPGPCHTGGFVTTYERGPFPQDHGLHESRGLRALTAVVVALGRGLSP